MRIKLLAVFVVILLALSVLAAPYKGAFGGKFGASIDLQSYIAANKILMFVTNRGSFGYDQGSFLGKSDGMYYPFTSLEAIDDGSNISTVIFAAGIWLGAKDSATGNTLVAASEYSDDYWPGPMIDTGGGNYSFDPNSATNPDYRVYQLFSDSMANNPNQDYLDWPVADGAPVDSNGNPKITGDQMLWAVYSDANPAQKQNSAGSIGKPLGIEIRQSTFAFAREGALANIVFVKFQIFNRGGKTLDSTIISIWADPDLGDAGDDFVGCDTVLSLGYCYNDGNDRDYGSNPPAVGYDFFQGPLIFTGSLADTAKMWGTTFPEHTNMPMTSFTKYINGLDPGTPGESYNYMLGLEKDGTPVVDHNGDTTKFFGSGDPVTGTGFLDANSSDRRFWVTTGPYDLAPGDSTEILAAIIVGRGADRLKSITELKKIDDFAQKVYDNDFVLPAPPAAPNVYVGEFDSRLILSWGDTSEVDPGDYTFEGYAVFQGASLNGPWDTLGWFDINNGVLGIIDFFDNPASAIPSPVIVKPGVDAGLAHYMDINTDRVNGGPLNNFSPYYYRIEAYSYDLSQPNGERTLTSATVVTAMPEPVLLGTELTSDIGQTITATHSTGTSDGSVIATIIDPKLVNGNSYMVQFAEDTLAPGADTVIVSNSFYDVFDLVDTCAVEWDDSIIIVTLCQDSTLDSTIVDTTITDDTTFATYWDMINTSTNDTIAFHQTNESGDESYPIADGLSIKVLGPPAEGKDWTYTAASPLNISPVVLADTSHSTPYAGDNRWFTGGGHGGELMFGGIFMEPNFWGATTVSLPDMKFVEVRFQPMESYTDLNGNAMYDVGEPYAWLDSTNTQGAFMYTTFSGSAYEGYYPVPFSAWDVTDPANPRQLNVVIRDRDEDMQWDLHYLADIAANPDDTLLPNRGDIQFNYTWILDSDYDATGTFYGDGTGGTIDFWDAPGGAVYDAMWVLWMDERGTSRGPLAEECTLTLIPNIVNSKADQFNFTSISTPVKSSTGSESDLANIKTVPNPYYLFSDYDNSTVRRVLKFTGLPELCTITLYNISGDLINTIEKDDATTSEAQWNGTNFAGIPVASGIYIYVVEAPGFGQKVGKLAIFTEVELLNQY